MKDETESQLIKATIEVGAAVVAAGATAAVKAGVDLYKNMKKNEQDRENQEKLDELKVKHQKELDKLKVEHQKAMDELKVEHKERLASQELGIDEQHHLQRMRHMVEEAQLKQLLKEQSTGVTREGEEASTPHPLLVTDDTPDEYSAEDYDDVEDGGVAEIMGDWIHEGDVAIVFAPTGVGKSIFSMQLAMDLAEGVPTKAFPVSAPPKQQHVLYVDFEMMPKEQKQRYGTRLKHLKEQSLGEHMLTWHYYGKRVAKEAFFNRIAEHVQTIEERNITIVIDNLDKLIAQWGADAPGYVVDTMFILTANAARMLDKNVTAIIVGHARKQTRKQKANDIDEDDLFGSSHQRNAGKVLIAIDPSEEKAKGYTWLRLLKNRNGKKYSVRAKRITDEEPGNFHFEYLDENTLHVEEEVQLDSASAPSTKTDSPYVGFSPRAYGELSDTEKLAIYQIVRMELGRKTKGTEIVKRLCALGPIVSEVNVSNIKKDTQGDMPKKLLNNANMDEVNKLRELYFSEYKSIKG